MPPKKGKATPAKAATATAASGRPRRESAAVKPAPVVEAKTEPKPAGKKRGRPAKAAAKGAEDNEDAAEPPKKRGRPANSAKTDDAADPPKKKAGRPSKAATESTAKKPGRPAKSKPAPAVPDEEPEPKRLAPPFGGESTKQDGDGDAAAEQLGEELADTATSKRIVGDGAANDEEEAVNAGGKQFWLMKAEQEDRFETAHNGQVNNTKFTIDDLRNKNGSEPWDGVRNPQAAKHMRAMRKGDLAFFYASGGKAGRKPGITGIMEIVSEHEPDPSTHDAGSYGYVEKEGDREKWCMVQVAFRSKLTSPVTLAELQKYRNGDDSGILKDMQVLKLTRLSVSKVSTKEWNFIVDNLIEGYEK